MHILVVRGDRVGDLVPVAAPRGVVADPWFWQRLQHLARGRRAGRDPALAGLEDPSRYTMARRHATSRPLGQYTHPHVSPGASSCERRGRGNRVGRVAGHPAAGPQALRQPRYRVRPGMIGPLKGAEAAKAKLLPDPMGYRILCAVPHVEEEYESGIIKAEDTKRVEEQTTVVLFVLKLGALAYKDESRFPTGPWCKEGDWIIFGQIGRAHV